MNQNEKPIYKSLKKHSQKNPISLHVPGHKYGVINPFDDSLFINNIFKLDATELSGLDDLHHPEGVILEAEQLLAELYQVKKSYFLVNGSTVGNLAMILAAAQENEIVLVQRNCHKSVLNGIFLAKAEPVFLGPEPIEDWGIASGVSYETVEKAIKLYPNAKAIILTYPNYYGMVYELGKIIKLAHDHGIPVLIDEAHGAHFIAGEPFPESAVSLGADVVVQSAHKTLPALTMGSYLHFNSKLVSLKQLEKYLGMLQSSSPSYPLMASLDCARSYLGTFQVTDKRYVESQIRSFIKELREIKEIKVLDYPQNKGDLLKVTIQSRTELTGFDLQLELEKEGIFTELADLSNVLLVLPLLKEGNDYPFIEIIKTFKKVLANRKIIEQSRPIFFKKGKITKLQLSHNQLNTMSKKALPFREAVGLISADYVIPYPPGIPLLFPGEEIKNEDIDYIEALLKSKARFQGSHEITKGILTVFTD